MKQHRVIYIPGIKDDLLWVQSSAIRLWRLHGVRGHCHEMPWAGDEAWEPKFQRLLDEIDSYAAQGHKVSLVGASAGASAILNAYFERTDKIHRLVYICAKINAPETVSQKTYAENPAFKTSLKLLQGNLKKLTATDKAKMHSYYSPNDGNVPYAATVIEGVAETRLPALRHGRAIIYCMTFGAPKLMRFLK
jgi:pimeloyl-ACP methyl ester carboxylesterase